MCRFKEINSPIPSENQYTTFIFFDIIYYDDLFEYNKWQSVDGDFLLRLVIGPKAGLYYTYIW